MYSLLASSSYVVSFECRLYIEIEDFPSEFAPNHPTSRPFRGLEHLAVEIADLSTPHLIHGPMLQSLTHLHLRIDAGNLDVLPTVSGLVQLRILNLHFLMNVDDIEFDASELLRLSALRELREIYVYCKDAASAPDFTDLLLAQLVACWPHLRVWDVRIYADLSPAAFRLIGEHCRELRKLKMYGASTLCAFELPPPAALSPLFPQLRSLTFETTVGLDPTGLK
jgi:hypothetical protein